MEALSLVKECRELEAKYRSDFISQILNATDPTTGTCALKEAEDHIVREDRALYTATENLTVQSNQWDAESYEIKHSTMDHPV